MRPSLGATWLGTSLLLLSLSSCVSGDSLALPSAPSGTLSRLVVELCDGAVRAWVAGPDAASLVLNQTCAREARIFVVHYPEPPESFGWSVGPLALDACPVAAPCCYPAAIPAPEDPTFLQQRARTDDGAWGDWEPREDWPEALSTLRYPRRCHCPKFDRITPILAVNYEEVEVGVLDSERLVIAARTVPKNPAETHIFHSTISELLDGGFPTEPLHRLLGFDLEGLEIDARGNFILGNNAGPEVALGRSDGSIERISHPDPEFRPHRVLIRSTPSGEIELTALSQHHATQIFHYRSGTWTAFEGRDQMRGRCEANSDERQRASARRISDTEVLLMPEARGCSDEAATCTTTTAPDGFWHESDGVPRWIRVDKEEGSCLTQLAHTPELGILAMTRRPRILQRETDQWRDLVPPEELGDLDRDQELRDLLRITGGVAFTRQGGRVGAIVERHVCETLAFDPSVGLRGMHRVGDRLLVEGEVHETSTTDATLYLIDVDWTENRLLEP